MYIIYDKTNEACSEPCETVDECFNSLVSMDCIIFGSMYKIIDLDTNLTKDILLSCNNL